MKLRDQMFTFYVVQDGEPILSKHTCEVLGLVKRQVNTVHVSRPLLEKYSDVFKGLGCIAKNYHLDTDKHVTPVVDPPRRIPHAIQDKVKKELQRMESLNVIIRETEPTEWVNSMTVVSEK